MKQLAAALTAATLAISAPTARAQWTQHTSFDGTTMTAEVGGLRIAGNSQGLVVRDEAQGLTQTLNKTNYLTQGGISAIGTDGRRLVVGYSDGGIDIIDLEDRHTTNIPELRNNGRLTQKKINSITPAGRFCYLGFASGILELDTHRDEVRSSWGVTTCGVSVTDVALAGGYIYAATSAGIYRAKSDSRILEDAAQWSLMGSPSGNALKLESRADTVFAAVGSLGSNAEIWKIVDGQASKVLSIGTFRHMSESGGKMIVTQNGAVNIYGPDWRREAQVTKIGSSGGTYAVQAPAFRQARATKGGDLLIADYNECLVISDTGGNGRAYKPNGPRGNIHSAIITAGDVVYVAGPGRSSYFNNQGNPASVSILRDGVWKESHLSWANSREPCFLTSNPSDDEEVYLSTWGTGVFRIAADTIGEHYSAANSTMKDIFGGKWYTRTDGIAMDKTGNLYVIACQVDTGINVRTPDGEWYGYTYGPFGNAHSYRRIAMTPNGNVWVGASRFDNSYYGVFNINGTPETPDDDRYMGSRATTSDPQYVGELSLTDAETGELVSSYATAFAADADGDVWVGTVSGPLVTHDNKTMLNTGVAQFNRIKQPRNDGTNLADYLLDGVEINQIAVDGANRKWIATATDGVYLVSPDGKKTILHFTAANSPLPSDEVLDVAISQRDGEVYFVTANGIASYRSDATTASKDFSQARIYPNPYKIGGAAEYVTIDQIALDTDIRITDASGARVWRGKSVGGTARWDGRRDDGRLASAGVYIVWMTSPDGEMRAAGKILITR